MWLLCARHTLRTAAMRITPGAELGGSVHGGGWPRGTLRLLDLLCICLTRPRRRRRVLLPPFAEKPAQRCWSFRYGETGFAVAMKLHQTPFSWVVLVCTCFLSSIKYF